MKVYGLPAELKFAEPDYRNFDREKERARKEAHTAKLAEWLRAHGYTGKHTGKIYRTPIADGYAEYMLADGKTAALFHLPYAGGYASPDVKFLPKAEVLRRIKASEEFEKLFRSKAA
jgi:hypothetical protein